ncbi:MAG: hypothetical protein ACYTBJ_15755 [Planctomycetota bacterium]|jgi:hypothetical protein
MWNSKKAIVILVCLGIMTICSATGSNAVPAWESARQSQRREDKTESFSASVRWGGEKVLEKLREFDALYFKKGFTARGTITAPAEPQIGKPEITRRWELTAQRPRVALVLEANEDDIPTPKFVHKLPDRYSDYTPEGHWLVDVMTKKYMHFGKDWIGSFEELNHYAVDRQDKLVNVNVGFIHFANFCEPPDEGFGPFYHKSELLWSLGRGYSEIIHKITRVEQLADGRFVVSALGLLKTGGKRRDQWQLTIDPKAAWMVRHARCNWDPDGDEVEYEAKNSSLIWNGPLAIPERITWQRRGWRGPYIQQISCRALEAKANESLLSKARAVVLPPYPANTEVSKYTRDDVDDDYDAEELLKLVEQPLPPFEGIGIGFDTAEAKGKDILLCFFDMNQRPSRHMVAELAKQAPQLKQKGVAVLCVQAPKVDKEKLDEWVTHGNIPFAVRMAEDDASKIRFTWCVKSLPWLILTDKKHVVVAEGFNLEELDEKIKESETNNGKD